MIRIGNFIFCVWEWCLLDLFTLLIWLQIWVKRRIKKESRKHRMDWKRLELQVEERHYLKKLQYESSFFSFIHPHISQKIWPISSLHNQSNFHPRSPSFSWRTMYFKGWYEVPSQALYNHLSVKKQGSSLTSTGWSKVNAIK